MIKIKVKKSRMWIPALGVVIAYGFFHNCAIAPYFNCRIVDWVLILILMEHAQRECLHQLWAQSSVSLNPCFSGTCSKS